MSAPDHSTVDESIRPSIAMSTLSSKDELDHAWRYFALHAGQRMSTFHYFLILYGLVSAGLAGCLRAGGSLTLVGAALSLMLAGISYAFYKLDQRTAFLIKHVEEVLQILEHAIPNHTNRVFSTESETTATARATRNLWTYGKAFRVMFFVSACVGALGAVFSLWLYTCHYQDKPAEPSAAPAVSCLICKK